MAVRTTDLPLRSMLRTATPEVICWEALQPRGKALRQARRIYESCLPEEERIPWRWIKEGLARERVWPEDRWSCHLLLAGLRRPGEEKRRVIGFAYGAHVPGFGGYGGYLGVDPRYRGRGVGTRLWRLLIQRLQLDAACAGVPLPFVIWESRPPEKPEEQAVWQSRLRVWGQLGAWQIEGVHFLTPNFADRDGEPVSLQLFLKPVDMPAAAFDATTLRSVVTGLHRFVYELPRDDDLATATLSPATRPRLQSLGA
jgi:GNAT superfamily N-acetyltransferase